MSNIHTLDEYRKKENDDEENDDEENDDVTIIDNKISMSLKQYLFIQNFINIQRENLLLKDTIIKILEGKVQTYETILLKRTDDINKN